jgi:hypothetical protein
MSRLSAYRWSAHVSVLGATVLCASVSTVLLAGPASAGTTASAMAVKVSPDRGLVNGQIVTVSGRGFSHTATGSGLTWFVTECTATVHGRMNPSTDTPHCDVTDAKAIRVSHNGSFSTKFRVRAGIVGDGYCGTAGHTSCVIVVSTAKGGGTVAKISFAAKPATTGTSTSTSPSTTSSASHTSTTVG